MQQIQDSSIQGRWTYCICLLFLIFLRYPSHHFLKILVLVLLAPQYPEWNPILPDMTCIVDYATAKKLLFHITWGMIFVFYLMSR